jgi:hypothetical protein
MFRQFGRSLKEGESVDITSESSRPAILTPERRRALVHDGETILPRRSGDLRVVAGVEWEKGSFTLRMITGEEGLVTAPLTPSIWESVREAGGRQRTVVAVSGVAICDAEGRVKNLEKVTHLDLMVNFDLSLQFDALLPYIGGWADGEGLPVDSELRQWLIDSFLELYPERPCPTLWRASSGGNCSSSSHASCHIFNSQ